MVATARLIAAAMPAKKHHYIPKCYLRQWTGDDGKLCEFSRPFRTVLSRRCHPSQTGYEIGLYDVETLPPDEIDVVERKFFGRVDQQADDVLRMFLDGQLKLSPKQQDGWARFLMSLLQRNPTRVAELKALAEATYLQEIGKHAALYAEMDGVRGLSFDEYRAATDRDTIAKFGGMLIQQLSDLPRVGRHINGMNRQIVTLTGHPWKLLTSDRPLLQSDGLGKPGAYVTLPISPNHLFVATNDDETARWINQQILHGDFIKRTNEAVVRMAHHWVYAIDESQHRFIANRADYLVSLAANTKPN